MTRDSLSGTSDDTARNAIDALRDAWVAAVAAADAGALRDMVTPDYEVWAHGAPTLAGPDAVVGAMRAALAKYAITQSYEPIETVVSGDWGFQRGIERIRAVPLDGGPVSDVTQRGLLIVHRGEDGRWRYARGMTNGFPPATAAAERSPTA